jgi:hypothetical protein
MREILSKKKGAPAIDRATLGVGIFDKSDAMTASEVTAEHRGEYEAFYAAAEVGKLSEIVSLGSFFVQATAALLSLFDDALVVDKLSPELNWMRLSCSYELWSNAGEPKHSALGKFPLGTGVAWDTKEEGECGLQLVNCIVHRYGELLTWILVRYHQMYGAARQIAARTADSVLARDLFHLKHRHWVRAPTYYSSHFRL